MIEKLLITLNRHSIKFRFFRYLPLLSLFVFLLVTYQLWSSAQREADEVLQADFNAQVQEVKNKIEIRMQNYEHLLRGVQGLFAATSHVDRNDFHAYANEVALETNYPGMQSLGFNLLIAKQDKLKHIASIRKKGYRQYSTRPDHRGGQQGRRRWHHRCGRSRARGGGWLYIAAFEQRADIDFAVYAGEITVRSGQEL